MTTRAAVTTGDMTHLGLLLMSLAAAYYIPFERVILSYAILGPLHYLTEISWLRERNYFLPTGNPFYPVMLVTLLGMILLMQDPRPQALLLYFTFCFCAIFALFKQTKSRVIAVVAAALIGLAALRLPAIDLILISLLPTVIHVCLFTFVFMLVGALRSRSVMQFVLVGGYTFSVLFIFVYPSTAILHGSLASVTPVLFKGVGNSLGHIVGTGPLPVDARLAEFLSFVYTYHYLNWFIKVRVINWHKVPAARLAVLGALAVSTSALYFVDYKIGVSVLLSLSLLHVILEFPLNAISIKQLGQFLLPSRRAAE